MEYFQELQKQKKFDRFYKNLTIMVGGFLKMEIQHHNV